MTPAINVVKKSGIRYQLHEYTHDDKSDSYGLEAAQKLAVPVAQVFKTLVVSLDAATLAVGVIPVSCKLSMKQFSKAAGKKKAMMAEKTVVERSTGYVLGGVSPIGQKNRLLTYIDSSAQTFSSVFVSAGRRGLEIELTPTDLQELTKAKFVGLTSKN